MMKTLLLTSTVFLAFIGAGFASASVELQVQEEGGELAITHNQKKVGFIQRGGKNYWKTIYTADPGTYTLRGKNPGCPEVVRSTSFEDGKAYLLVLTKDCRIESPALKSKKTLMKRKT